MTTYPNFYENIEEARNRLLNTIVLYDGAPFYVRAITNHKPDGIYRIYIDPVRSGMRNGAFSTASSEGDFNWGNYPSAHPSLGPQIDAFMAGRSGSGCTLLRKHMNSPLFNKYRPFPLGMLNTDGRVLYCERQPLRPKMEQGLTASMVSATVVSVPAPSAEPPPVSLQFLSDGFRACILGEHPSFEECIAKLLDPEVVNKAVAFDRNFALVRGPIDSLFLAYKADIIATVDTASNSVRIGKKYIHTREVVGDLGVFSSIDVI